MARVVASCDTDYNYNTAVSVQQEKNEFCAIAQLMYMVLNPRVRGLPGQQKKDFVIPHTYLCVSTSSLLFIYIYLLFLLLLHNTVT